MLLICLQLLFLYGIIKESLCLSSSYATFIIIGIVMAVVEANNSAKEEEDSSALAEIWWWVNLIWIVFTTIVSLIFVIDLMRMQRISKSNRDRDLP